MILYEFPTANGPVSGKADVGEAFKPEFETHWPEVVYNPAFPHRHMLFDKMWAVNWKWSPEPEPEPMSYGVN